MTKLTWLGRLGMYYRYWRIALRAFFIFRRKCFDGFIYGDDFAVNVTIHVLTEE